MAEEYYQDQAAGIQPADEFVDQKALELAKDFSYEGYQVVRRELFAHLREPAVVIRRDSITFNTACIAGMEDVIYIQVLINPQERKMVVRRSDENEKDALRWCIAKSDKRKSRKVTGKAFSAKLYDVMGWNTDCRYKILGHKVVYEDEMIYIFDLTETEIFLDKRREKSAVADSYTTESGTADMGNSKAVDTRKAYFPEYWKDTFGLPVEEHKKALEINIREGYTEFKTRSNQKA